ncbi:alkylhydroperoxidase family enzyme [Caulobacter ginsengisoli]|uniref:Alkylhydroperoxidase family enzyme n=1 Tax=Caulobacter ginsengisoli TaxID=400775 RepID=A0ABU0IQA7_9CAUL|nr:alkylhydroperoxidase family enzyme [Caulobacter ginsengisoli]
MSRLAPATPPWSDAIARTLAPLTPEGTEPLILFRTLARDERLFSRFMGGGLLDRGHLTLTEREIVIDRICALNGAEYEWGVHAAIFAEAAGLTPERLAATVHGDAASPCWTPKEALLIRFCDAVNAKADIDDALWAALGEHFSEMARLELMLLAGFYRTVSLLVNGLRLPMEPGAIPFPA